MIARLVQAIAPEKGEFIVEIGPGEGALTRPLLERAGSLHVVELDRDLAAALRSLGSPVWLRMIDVSGKSRARRAASARCHQGVCRSKRKFNDDSLAKPARHFESVMPPGAASSGDAFAFGL